MAKIDEMAGAEEIPESPEIEHEIDTKTDEVQDVHIPHLPLTGVQKIVCIIELIMAGMLTVFIFSTIFKHLWELSDRI
jgi:hypothetical protein